MRDWLALTATRVINPRPEKARLGRVVRELENNVDARLPLILSERLAAKKRLFRGTGAYSATIPAQRHSRSPWQRIVFFAFVHAEMFSSIANFSRASHLGQTVISEVRKFGVELLLRGAGM